MTYTSISSGRFTTSVVDSIATPRIIFSKSPLVYCHGLDGNGAQGIIQRDIFRIISGCIDLGYSAVCPSTGNSWGNSSGMDRVEDSVTFSRESLSATDDPPILIGVSMGTVTAFQYARSFPCAGVINILPIINLQWCRENDPEGIDATASIEAAWSIGSSDPLPENSDPLQYADQLVDIPLQLWYANDDDVSHDILDFVDITGAEVYNLGDLGHTSAAVSAIDIDKVLTFVKSL